MPTAPFTFRMDNELRKSLEREAQYEDRPASQLANRAIKTMIEAREAKRQAIDAALEEAEKGEFISQGALNQWMDSWDGNNELPIPQPDIKPRQQ